MAIINQSHFLGNSNLGIFMTCWNNKLLVPSTTPSNLLKLLEETLQTKPVQATIAETGLLGLFAALNDHGILLPYTTTETELAYLKQAFKDINVDTLDSKITALGNTILPTNNVIIVSPEFTQKERKTIEDILDAEVIPKYLVGTHLVGSVAFSTEIGTLVHPNATDEDLEFLKTTLKTNVDITTVNRGIPYPKSGIVANTKGAVVGSDTTGPENMRIFETLFT